MNPVQVDHSCALGDGDLVPDDGHAVAVLPGPDEVQLLLREVVEEVPGGHAVLVEAVERGTMRGGLEKIFLDESKRFFTFHFNLGCKDCAPV